MTYRRNQLDQLGHLILATWPLGAGITAAAVRGFDGHIEMRISRVGGETPDGLPEWLLADRPEDLLADGLARALRAFAAARSVIRDAKAERNEFLRACRHLQIEMPDAVNDAGERFAGRLLNFERSFGAGEPLPIDLTAAGRK